MKDISQTPPMIPVFDEQLDLLQYFKDAPERTYRKGDILFYGGGPKRKVLLITRGTVMLSTPVSQTRDVIDGYYLKGDLLNPEALTGNSDGQQYARAALRTRVKYLSSERIWQVMESNPAFANQVLRLITSQLQASRNRVQRISQMTSRQRVLQFLLDYLEKAGRRVGLEYVIDEMLTHGEIAALTDTSRQTVNTVLNDLRKKEVVHFNRRYLIVRDLAYLEAAMLRVD